MYRGTYTLIGQELSMFTRKLEAQLRYQNIPYQWQYKTMEWPLLLRHAQVPDLFPYWKRPMAG